jgi:hypothetical protein
MTIEKDIELIRSFHNRISNIYFEKKIVPLRGFGTDGFTYPYELPNGKNLIQWTHTVFNDIMPFKEIIKNNDELLFLSDEIVYFIALLYFYQPFLENSLNNPIIINNENFYIADQTIEEKRHDMFVDILYEKTYSFFDRIAILISKFFPTKFLKKENIHYHKTIETLKNDYITNDDFAWLLRFRDNEYKIMNNERRNAVHNISTVTKNFNSQRFINYKDYEGTKGLIERKFEYADYFKHTHTLCIEGFEKTLSFLEYVKSQRGVLS